MQTLIVWNCSLRLCNAIAPPSCLLWRLLRFWVSPSKTTKLSTTLAGLLLLLPRLDRAWLRMILFIRAVDVMMAMVHDHFHVYHNGELWWWWRWWWQFYASTLGRTFLQPEVFWVIHGWFVSLLLSSMLQSLVRGGQAGLHRYVCRYWSYSSFQQISSDCVTIISRNRRYMKDLASLMQHTHTTPINVCILAHPLVFWSLSASPSLW